MSVELDTSMSSLTLKTDGEDKTGVYSSRRVKKWDSDSNNCLYFSMDRDRTADMVSKIHPSVPVSNWGMKKQTSYGKITKTKISQDSGVQVTWKAFSVLTCRWHLHLLRCSAHELLHQRLELKKLLRWARKSPTLIVFWSVINVFAVVF